MIGAAANQMYGVRHVPVAVARIPATAGAAKNERWPPVMCMPIAVPRTRGENVRAMSAAAGPWYDPETMPSTMRSARSCQYEPAVASATLAAPMRKSPPTMTTREPTRSASMPHGALARPAAMENAETAKPLSA